MKENQLASVISIDFQKAFDSVSPQILPQKIQASGLCGDSLDWIVNYLKNLHQFVSINGTISVTMGLTSGVPKVPCWAQDFSASLQMTCLCPLSQR